MSVFHNIVKQFHIGRANKASSSAQFVPFINIHNYIIRMCIDPFYKKPIFRKLPPMLCDKIHSSFSALRFNINGMSADIELIICMAQSRIADKFTVNVIMFTQRIKKKSVILTVHEFIGVHIVDSFDCTEILRCLRIICTGRVIILKHFGNIWKNFIFYNIMLFYCFRRINKKSTAPIYCHTGHC